MHEQLTPYGWDREWSDATARAEADLEERGLPGPWRPGRVVRHDGAGLLVATDEGIVRSMFGPSVDPAPVVGDWVLLDAVPNPAATLPRRSLLRRRAAGAEREQPLVANVDLVLVVCGLDRPIRPGRIRRTVAIAIDAGAESLVVLTKADQASPGVAAEAELIVAEEDPDLPVVTLSAKGGWGIDDLVERIGARTVALIGESGAGKSTLVNALAGREVALEGRVRDGDAKGRHTTTSRELHLLPGAGVLVDTPGIREVGVWTDADTVDEAFPDIEELATACRFRDCAHATEPGCAVLAAVEGGELAAERLAAWRQIEAEVASAELRADLVEQRRRGRQFGRIAREAQQAKDDQRRGPT